MALAAAWSVDANMISGACPLVVTGAIDINSDPGCYRAIDPDIALCKIPSQDNTLTLGDSTDPSDQHVLGGNMALGHPHGHRL